MRCTKHVAMAAGMLAAAFAGGAAARWLLPAANEAAAQRLAPAGKAPAGKAPAAAPQIKASGETVYARQFVLLDEKSKPRAILHVEPAGNAALDLCDAKGQRRIRLQVHADGQASVSLSREAGDLFAGLSPSRGFTMRDEKGRRALSLEPKGLLFYHDDGNVAASYWSRRINFYSAKGRGIVLPSAEDRKIIDE